MKITAFVATAGAGGFMGVPCLPFPGEHYIHPDGTFDEAETRRALAGTKGVQFSSKDNRASLMFTVEFLDRTRLSMDRLMANEPGVRKKQATDTEMTRAEQKYEKGKIAYASVTIRASGTGLHAIVSAKNPKEVVGGTELFAKLYAQTFADNLVAIADAMKEAQDIPVILEEGEGCEGVLAAARERNDTQARRNRHEFCVNRVHGYCSPSNPACECYRKGGKCEFEK